LSSTCTLTVPVTKPLAAASILTDWVPSATLSSTRITEKVTEPWPSGIVTVAGTVASLGSLLLKLTSRSPLVPGARLTVAVNVPAASDTSSTGSSSVSVGGRSPTRASTTASAIT
jgi:hypothetical protein